jgi:hypothetical protein
MACPSRAPHGSGSVGSWRVNQAAGVRLIRYEPSP